MMPFGLSNAGATFCRLMEMCLGDQLFITLLYSDDICIFASSIDQMLDCIQPVFNRLESFNLKIKPSKSSFFQTEVLFLGYILTGNCIKCNPDKIDKVKNWPIPKNLKELLSFIGLASYYTQFIKDFAKIAGCLHDLLGPTASKKTSKRKQTIHSPVDYQADIVWTEEYNEAFELLKEKLTTAPVLAYPDFKKPFVVETDASLKGLGAVLMQKDDENNAVKVIAYASRSLQPSEKSMKNYSSAKLELLALKWVVTEKFIDYLLGSKLTIVADNNPLAYVNKSKLGVAQICWMSDLALFDFGIKYRSGSEN